MYVGLFVGHSISIFVFGESWCVDVLLSFRCISENMCGAEIHGFFYYRLHFPSRKASIQNKMRNSTCVESSLQPTFPFNILHFPRCLFWCRKKGCSSTPFHPFFGPKWHAKCVLAADVGQIVNSLWHLAAGLSSGDVWGELPHKKQKTSEFETHLFRLLKLQAWNGIYLDSKGFAWHFRCVSVIRRKKDISLAKRHPFMVGISTYGIGLLPIPNWKSTAATEWACPTLVMGHVQTKIDHGGGISGVCIYCQHDIHTCMAWYSVYSQRFVEPSKQS